MELVCPHCDHTFIPAGWKIERYEETSDALIVYFKFAMGMEVNETRHIVLPKNIRVEIEGHTQRVPKDWSPDDVVAAINDYARERVTEHVATLTPQAENVKLHPFDSLIGRVG
jgi:hypothetical protein